MNPEETKNLERLASLETEIRTIKEYLVRLDGKLDAYATMYVPRQEINEMFRSRDKEIQDTKDDIQEMKNSRDGAKNLWVSWVSVAVAVIALAATVIK